MTHKIEENRSKFPDGPTKKNKPMRPIKTPVSLKQENSPLYKENSIKAVKIGTVACSMDNEPAPKVNEAQEKSVNGRAVFRMPISKIEKLWS